MLDNRKKGCFVALSHFFWVGLIWQVGCVSTDVLNRKVDLVENEIADVTQENRRLQQRMDELQIQLSQVMNKLKTLSERLTLQKTPENSSPQAQKSHHSKSDVTPPMLSNKNEKAARVTTVRRATMTSGPATASERLPVDPAVAKQPLLGGTTDHNDTHSADSIR